MLRILDERRIDLLKHHGRVINQLHALLRELVPGGIKRDFDPEDAAATLKRFEPDTPADAMRTKVGLEMDGDIRRVRFQIEEITARIKSELAACGTRLPKILGVGPVTACRILARTGYQRDQRYAVGDGGRTDI